MGHRRVSVMLLCSVIVVAAGCGRSEGPLLSADEAYERADKAYDAAATLEDKVAISKDYLAKYPASEHAVDMAWSLADDLGGELGQPGEVAALIGAAAAKAEEPGLRFELGALAARQAIEAGQSPDVTRLAAELEAQRPLTYSEHADVTGLAVDTEQWPLVLQHGEAALGLATPAAFRADYPDREFDDDYVARAAARRATEVLPAIALAQFESGAVDEAEATFARADAETGRGFVGTPPNDLDLYWGRMELERGNPEAALARLAPEAVMGGNEEAMAPFKAAYLALGRDEAAFDEYLWQQRQELARPALDFALPGYDGTSHSLSDFNGQVVMLTFWFPT